MAKRLVVIDGKSVFYRGYYAMPTLATKDGTPTGGVYGFATLSLEVIKKLNPDYVVVAWDKKGTNIRRRKEIYPEYKAGRKPAPPDFYEQIPMLMELLEAFSWPLVELDDYEADDIMGTLAIQASKQAIETCFITSDLDVLQCVGPLTHVYALKKGFSNIQLYNPESFEQKYGIDVHQFVDYKALVGDSSDNLPGVAGVGPVAASKLLQDYQTLDGVYEHLADIKPAVAKKLEASRDNAYLTKKLAQIWTDAPVELALDAADVHDLDSAKLKQLLTELEFRSLLGNLPEHMSSSEPVDTDGSDQPALTPVKQVSFDDTTKVALSTAEQLVVYQASEDEFWLSAEAGRAVKLPLKQAGKLLKDAHVVAHDAKSLLKSLLAGGYADLPTVAHDTEQAAFLLDPLDKNRSLSSLVSAEVDAPESAVSALWRAYVLQGDSLQTMPELARVAREVDFALVPVLARMEHHGIILDTDYLQDMNKKLSQQIGDVQKQMFDTVGYEFNIGSPAQLSEVLFNQLKLPTTGIKKGKTGYSTGQKELDKLRGQHEIIELIEKYRELSKLQNTYVEALPKLVDEHSRLHTDFRQDVAATGRLSSINPNLQNIPVRSEVGRKIRNAFVPSQGNVFVSADYSQFELRLAAVLSGDEELVEAFNSDIDIHAKTASDVYGVPIDQVTKNQRSDAKVINFGVLYGMGPHALSQNTGMSYQDAKEFIDTYFEQRAPIRRYIDATIEQAKSEGYVETMFGRRRPTPDINSSNFVVREAAKRAAANMPIQGTEADLMKMAMLAVEEQFARLASSGTADGAHATESSTRTESAELPSGSSTQSTRKSKSSRLRSRTSSDNIASTEQSSEETRLFKDSKLPVAGSRLSQVSSEDVRFRSSSAVQVLQIHDSILVECKKADAERVGEVLKSTMENVYPELGIKLKVDVTQGNTWGKLA